MEGKAGRHSFLISLLHQVAQKWHLLMFQADKTLDGDTKLLQPQILFLAVGKVGVQTLQLIVQQLQQLIQQLIQLLTLQQLQHCQMEQQLLHCQVPLQLQQQFQVL